MAKHLLNIIMWGKSMTSIPDYMKKEHEKRLGMSIEINQNLFNALVRYISHFGSQSNVYEQLTDVKGELEKNLKALKEYD